jgi:hypothetical protein
VTLEARVAAPAGTELVLFRDGEILQRVSGDTLRIPIGAAPGVYRIEAHLPARRGRPNVPWLVANPIYVNLKSRHAVSPPVEKDVVSRSSLAADEWRTESSAGSDSVLRATPSAALDWRVRLAEGPAVAQFAAIAFAANHRLANFDRVRFRMTAGRPMRIWAQLRLPQPRGDQRWATSFYVDGSAQTIDLAFADFRPLGPVASDHPPLADIDAFLIVVDTLNTLPGTSTTFTVEDFALVK